MTIFENKKLERDTFRKLRDGISLDQRENVEKNVRLYIDSFVKGYKNIGYIGIYWPLKNEVDIRSLKKKFTLAKVNFFLRLLISTSFFRGQYMPI